RVIPVHPRGMSTGLTVTGPATALSGPGELELEIAVPGRHFALDATAALAITVQLGVSPADAVAGLAAYRGARRRMELKGEADGVQVVDSYAHHPTELAADVTAAHDIAGSADGGGGRVKALFKPP